ncbi:MAG: hypothetical protein LBJ10_01795 [Clostridiales bacterium]|nr:hypothetical protein [Clostridiales bacterium]
MGEFEFKPELMRTGFPGSSDGGGRGAPGAPGSGGAGSSGDAGSSEFPSGADRSARLGFPVGNGGNGGAGSLGGAAGRGAPGAPGGGGAAAGGAQGAQDYAAQAPAFTDKRARVRVHIGSSASTFVVSVLGFSGPDMSGRILHLYSKSEYEFRTLFELVRILQGIADMYDYPQKGYRLRSWAGEPSGLVPGGVARARGIPGADSPERAQAQAAHGAQAAPGAPGGERGESERGESGGGAEARLSFIVRLQYRQNVSWQGEAQWTDCKGGSATVQFRSLLELLALMSEAAEFVTKP